MSLVEDLRELKELHDAGDINDEEYAKAKSMLLSLDGTPDAKGVEEDPDGDDAPAEGEAPDESDPELLEAMHDLFFDDLLGRECFFFLVTHAVKPHFRCVAS